MKLNTENRKGKIQNIYVHMLLVRVRFWPIPREWYGCNSFLYTTLYLPSDNDQRERLQDLPFVVNIMLDNIQRFMTDLCFFFNYCLKSSQEKGYILFLRRQSWGWLVSRTPQHYQDMLPHSECLHNWRWDLYICTRGLYGPVTMYIVSMLCRRYFYEDKKGK